MTGLRLFEAPDYLELLRKKLTQEARPLGRVAPGTFSAELAAVVAKAVARRPEDRFQSAAEFHEAVVAIARSPGGGLARQSSHPLAKAVAPIANVYGGWYDCLGYENASWATRLRTLKVSRSGSA